MLLIGMLVFIIEGPDRPRRGRIEASRQRLIDIGDSQGKSDRAKPYVASACSVMRAHGQAFFIRRGYRF